MSKKLEILMDVAEVRKINLEYLIASTGGNLNKVAEISDTSANYLSQVKSEKTKKNMGSSVARKLEKAFKKEHGWMDKLHYGQSADYSHLNDQELLALAIRKIVNQLITSGVMVMNKKIDSSAISSFVVAEYKTLLEKRTIDSDDLDNSQAQ